MRYLLILCLSFFVACSDAKKHPDLNIALIKETGVTATLTPIAEDNPSGKWRVHYVFDKPQKIMFFSRSIGNYRTQTWVSADSNVTLERVNGFDALIFAQPTTHAKFVIEPYTESIRGDYTPFLKFSDNGIALFTGQFDLMPVKDKETLHALAGQINEWQGEQPTLGVRVLYDKNMIQNGRIVRGESVDKSYGGGNYIYIGDAKITEGQDFIGVIDSGLPDWLSGRFDKDLKHIYDGHRDLWGGGLPEKTTVFFSFGGYDGDGFRNQGGALNNVLALETSGQNLRNEDGKILASLHWFFAHEIAHLFQGRKNSNGMQSWMHEGAANAMAMNVLKHQGLVDDAYVNTEYAREFSECVFYLKEKRFSYYQCGNLIAQITDGALANVTLFEFWNELVDVSNKERQYTQEDYFNLMIKHGADQTLVDDIQIFLNADFDEPAKFVGDLMMRAHLQPKFDKDQNLISLKLP